MIFYHFKDLKDYFAYLKPSGWTFFDFDVQEVTTPDSLDYYVILTAYNMEKERVYVCVQQIGSHQKYAGRVENAAGRLGSKNDAASKKLIEAQKKADEKSRAQQKEQFVKEFKASAKKMYNEVEFSEGERRWSTEPLAYLPKSVEQVEVAGREEAAEQKEAAEVEADETEDAAKPAARGVRSAPPKKRLISKRK